MKLESIGFPGLRWPARGSASFIDRFSAILHTRLDAEIGGVVGSLAVRAYQLGALLVFPRAVEEEFPGMLNLDLNRRWYVPGLLSESVHEEEGQPSIVVRGPYLHGAFVPI